MFNFQSETVNNALIQLGEDIDVQKGRPFKSRFIQAGIAGYPKQFGNVLITKETLDGFVQTLAGKPVIINHKDNITKEDEVGTVETVWFNPEDGWFWCSGYLTDETAINLIKDKHWSVSCSYDVLLLDDEGGTENNIKYDKEFLKGVFTHLAIVENPRYERANIVVNSKTEILNKGIETMEIDNARGFNGEEGDWITTEKGVHIFVRKGQSKEDAVKEFIEKKQGGSSKEKQEKSKFDDIGEDELVLLEKADPEYIKKQKETNERWQKAIKETAEREGWDKEEKKQEKTSKIYDNLLNDSGLIKHLKESIKAQKAENPNAQVGDTVIDSDRYISLYTDKLTTEEYKNFNADKAEDLIFEKLNEMEREAGFKEAKQEPKQEGKDKDFSGMPKAETVKEQKLEGGISEITDKHGKTTFKKGNKWADVMKNGNYYMAAYGLTHKTGVSWEDEKGITHDQLLHSKGFKTEKGARKWALEQLKRITSDNSKEQDMSLLNKLINLIKEVQNSKGEKMTTKDRILNILNEKEVEEETIEEVENEFDEIEKEKKEKEVENKKKCKNEKVDKRKLIDEVAGMMKSAGCSDEIIRTAIKDMEKEAYDKSEDDGADNKKAKNEDEEKDEKEVKKVEKEVKEDVDNKCHNAVDYFNKINEVYNASTQAGIQNKYETQADRLAAGNKY